MESQRLRKAKNCPRAIKVAFEHDEKVVIEEAIDGFEVGCAVLGNKELIVGELDEIQIGGGFFDYKEKYTLETSKIHIDILKNILQI